MARGPDDFCGFPQTDSADSCILFSVASFCGRAAQMNGNVSVLPNRESPNNGSLLKNSVWFSVSDY